MAPDAIPLFDSVGDGAAEAIAEHWQLSLINATENRSAYLHWNGETLSLIQTGTDAPGPVYVDFVGGRVGHRRRFGGGRGQPLAKAVGLKSGALPSVIDATAGWGTDAFVLASLGCQVTLLERHTWIAALLEDGLRRARMDGEAAEIVKRMHLIGGDSRLWLEQHATNRKADVVYLDPMYPDTHGRSAKVKKGMDAFQRLLEGDADADDLLEPALAIANKRVVVKRPKAAHYLAGRSPSYSLDTKSHRFDVYVIAALVP